MPSSPQTELAVERAAAQDGGGLTVPLVPEAFAGPLELRGDQYVVNFASSQGQQVEVRRINVFLPVLLEETSLVHSEEHDITLTQYQNLEEANVVLAGKGGLVERTTRISSIGYDTPFSEAETIHTYSQKTQIIEAKETTVTEQSVLPLTAIVQLALYGPDGQIWAQTFEAPLHYLSGGTPGQYLGGGLVSAYADLTNVLTLRPDQHTYSLGISMFIPTNTNVNMVVGQEASDLEQSKAGPGLVTFFYDVENVPIGK